MTICVLPAKALPHKRGEMNRTERQYGEYLDVQCVGPEPPYLSWRYEPITFRLGPDCRYTPDMMVNVIDGSIEFHEVKGTSRGKPYARDDSKVKIRVAAEMYPEFRFVMVWQVRPGIWERKEF